MNLKIRERIVIGTALIALMAVAFFSIGNTPVSAFQNGWRVWEQHAVETPNQVAYGGFSNAIAVHKFGRNTVIGTTNETVWNVGALYVWPTAAETVTVVSTDIADDGAPVGDGARTFRVIGLDANYDDLQEDIILDGITPVVTTGAFLRVFRGFVLTAGADGSNAGTITAAQTTSALDLFSIEIDKGQTVLGLYTVADGKTLLISRIFGSVGRSVATAAVLELRVRTEGGAWRSVVYTGMHSTGSTLTNNFYQLPIAIVARTDIELVASATAASDINAGFDGYLVTIQ